MNHSHKNYQEKLACMLNFGECWTNPERTVISEKHGYSNQPSGVSFDRNRLNPIKH